MRIWKLFGLGALSLFAVACGGSGGDDNESGPTTLIAFDRDGEMYTIDSATAASTFVLETFFDNGTAEVDIGRVSSAIYNPVAKKIWLGPGGNSECESCVLALDVATGEGVFLADGDADAGRDGAPGMAISSANRIFVHEGDGDGLFEINNTTGVSTEVSSTTEGQAGNGMTFSQSGTLWLATNEKIYTIDQTTFDATFVADVSKVGFPTDVSGEIIALTTRPSDGTIFGIWKDGAGSGGSSTIYLITLVPSTGVMTYVGSMSENFDGLAFVPTSALPD